LGLGFWVKNTKQLCVDAFFNKIRNLMIQNQKPAILLHVCCAPCSPHVIELLSEAYLVHAFFYNPNIQPEEEYHLREAEMRAFAEGRGMPYDAGPYDLDHWNTLVRGLENEPEGGRRCEVCFQMRLDRTAAHARARGIPFFTTTLTVAPMKKTALVNAAGRAAAQAAGAEFFAADFKKKDGFKKSCDLARAHGFYRQNYCGCLHSRRG
jgi:epoxyqueuosine reductase